MRVPTAVCTVEGCGRPCHGRGRMCATHKARKLMGLPLCLPIRSYERDPLKRAEHALGEWYEALVRRREMLDDQRSQIDRMLQGADPIDVVRRAQALLAEADTGNDREWRSAQCALWKALDRYAEAHHKHHTAKHKHVARRRR